MMREVHADIAVIGGGTGGVAAALAALRAGKRVVLTEQYAWLGGQFTSQAVPPDEHPWVEEFGVTASYRAFREAIRGVYRSAYPMTDRAHNDPRLNPGAGRVSKLCHEPRAAVTAIELLFAPYRSSGQLIVLQPYLPVGSTTDGDRVLAVQLARPGESAGVVVTAPYFLDATETGELLRLASVEYVTGAEAHADTGEPHAPAVADPLNHQAITYCFAIDHVDGDHTIDRPASYDFWRAYRPSFWGAPLLSWSAPDPRTLEPATRSFTPNRSGSVSDSADYQGRDGGDLDLWLFRRILAREHFTPGFFASDIVLVNWPQVDYFEAPVIDVPDAEWRLAEARQLSLSMLYWMQTEAPRPDGGAGWPGLRLRPDVVGTEDGLAQAPYVRESRRIVSEYRIVEQDLALDVRGERGAVRYDDSVGVGMYRIDLHPSTGGDNYIDVAASPFQLPLGALIPVRVQNLLPAAKNIGTTHITNGCYRLHPVEWNVGEVVGELAAQCLDLGVPPTAVRATPTLLGNFQRRLDAHGIERAWPHGVVGY
jgi:hypothetical protein